MFTFTRTSIVNPIAVGALALFALVAASTAHAQATINQSKALAGSVTPGDAAGFPVTLSVPGAYKLTGNLVVPAGVSGIEITADAVTLDLNGFKIGSGAVCTRNETSFVVTCNMAAAGKNGVSLALLSATSIVRNGTVQGFEKGVALEGGIAEALVVKHNEIGVIFSGSLQANRATGIVAELNSIGVYMDGGLIERSVAFSNSVGFQGSISNFVAVLESYAGRNNIGIMSSAVRSNRVFSNKTNLVSTDAF